MFLAASVLHYWQYRSFHEDPAVDRAKSGAWVIIIELIQWISNKNNSIMQCSCQAKAIYYTHCCAILTKRYFPVGSKNSSVHNLVILLTLSPLDWVAVDVKTVIRETFRLRLNGVIKMIDESYNYCIWYISWNSHHPMGIFHWNADL